MTVALLLIATGRLYHEFARDLIKSANKFFPPHTTVLFTDSSDPIGDVQIVVPRYGFPEATLLRYHMFLAQEELLKQFDYLFYVDVDSIFTSSIGTEILGTGLTVVSHKGFNEHTWDFYLEHDKRSTAHLSYVQGAKYYVGGFNGGPSTVFLKAANVISGMITVDKRNGLRAKWNDESYMNRYLADIPPSTVLPYDYGFPETELKGYSGHPKLVFLEKSWRAAESEYR